MKVSVLVPVFNGERYLAECLESILTQDFHDLEILISDDGSTDGSAEIIKKFATRDTRIRWWKNPKNLGITANSNACLKAARGEYVKFVHQDDKLLSASAIRKMAAALDAHPNASLAGSRQHFTGHGSRPTIFSDSSGCFHGRRMIVTCIEQNNNLVGQPSFTLFRRLLSLRGFDEQFMHLMDYEMWFHLLEQGDYIYLAEPLATWRVHSQQLSEIRRKPGAWDREELLLLQLYYQKPWLQAAATQRMLFVQSRFLQRKYGRQAAGLVRKMRASQQPLSFLAYWVEQKFEKMKRWVRKKTNGFRQPVAPA